MTHAFTHPNNNPPISGWARTLLKMAMVVLLALPCSLPAARQTDDDRIAQIEFRSVTVGDALRILSEQSDFNVVASEKAARIPVTMFLRNVRPLEVLEAMSKTYNLWYRRDPKSRIVRVYTVDEFRLGEVDYSQEQTEVFTLKHEMNVLDTATAISDLFGERVILQMGSENDYQILSDLAQRFQRFNIIDSQSRLSTTGSGTARGRSGGGFGGGGSGGGGIGQGGIGGSGFGALNGRFGGVGGQRQRRQREATGETALSTEEVEEEMTRTEKLLGAIQEKRVVLEATRRTAPIYVTLIRRQNRLVVRTRDQDALEQIRQLIDKIDTDMATLLLEVKVLQVDLTDGYDSVFEFAVDAGNTAISKGNTNFATTPDTVAVPGVKTNPDGTAEEVTVAEKLGPAIINGLASTAPALGNPALLATLVSENFRARLQLMEREGRVTEVATPMLFTTNQEVSRIFIGEERPITTDVDVTCPSVGSGLVSTNTSVVCERDPQVEIRNIGDTLLLTPTINADGSVNIRMVIEQAATCLGCGSIPVPGNVDTTQTVAVDTVQTRTYTGSIVAQHSQPVAVGGLINERAEDTEEKVPVLGDIPLLGRLFRDEFQRRRRTELVIIVRPFVIESPSRTAQVSEGWLRQQSVHPALGNRARTLDVYKNPYDQHRGYELQAPYKTYGGQDAMDRYNRKDGYWESKHWPAAEEDALLADEVQQTYMKLTRHAAKAVRTADHTVANDFKIRLRPAPPRHVVRLTPNLEALPLASWGRGGLTVTALQLTNLSGRSLRIDPEALHGDWLAATVEKPDLPPGDNTYLYLISAGSFREALER
ncbi:MAG: DUF3438 family protein [Methylohalobius sp. ZOD2]